MDFIPQLFLEQAFRAVQGLMAAGVAWYVYSTARKAADRHGKWWSASRGAGWCLAFALFAAATMGSPTCSEDGDPIHGGCDQYADDGYDASLEMRVGRFIFFIVLLLPPVLLGASHAELPKRIDANSDIF